MTLEAFDYDPDFRRDPKDWQKPFCCRCQQNLDMKKAIAVTINEETFTLVIGHGREEEIQTNFNHQAKHLCNNAWIGKDCLKKCTSKSIPIKTP